jgi:hypothetical protein
MTLEIALWVGGQLVFNAGALVVGYVKLRERVVKVEVILDLIGRNAILSLHSPDDHLKLDSLVEEYVSRNYELSPEKWEKLKEICDGLIKDNAISKDETALAILGAGLATHKLMAFKKVKPKYAI